MLDGAYLHADYVNGNKFFHPSFKKGWRKLSEYNISFQAALRKLGSQVKYENQKYFLEI